MNRFSFSVTGKHLNMLSYHLSLQFWLTIIASFLLGFSRAYTIHQNCVNQGAVQWIQDAVSETLNIAEYASYRATNNRPTIDTTIFQSIIGNTDLNAFAGELQFWVLFPQLIITDATQGIMQKVPIALGIYTGIFNDQNLEADPTVVIHCGDSHLVKTNNPEPGWEDIPLRAGLLAKHGDLTPCVGEVGATAYTYPSNLSNGPKNGIVLCTGAVGAIDGSKAQDDLLTLGDKWRASNWN